MNYKLCLSLIVKFALLPANIPKEIKAISKRKNRQFLQYNFKSN
jgi:hypothetical protein